MKEERGNGENQEIMQDVGQKMGSRVREEQEIRKEVKARSTFSFLSGCST